jgi:hypothetical protein
MAGDLYRVGIEIEDATDSLYGMSQSLITGCLKVHNQLGIGIVWPHIQDTWHSCNLNGSLVRGLCHQFNARDCPRFQKRNDGRPIERRPEWKAKLKASCASFPSSNIGGTAQRTGGRPRRQTNRVIEFTNAVET